MSKPLLWTSIASVTVAAFSLAASGWVIANERGTAEAPVVAPPPPAAVVEAKAAPVVMAPAKDVVVPVAKALPTPDPTPAHADAKDLKVVRLVVAEGVKDREPVGAADSFAAGDRPVYAFVEMANRSENPGEIVVAFEKGSTRTGNVELAVPAKAGRHRTWAYSRGLRQAGEWQVVVRDAETGKELARKPLEITSPAVATDAPAAQDPAEKSAAAEAEMI